MKRDQFPTQQPLLALVPPVVALGLQWTFWSSLQPQVFVLFYPAVIASSWIGGLRGGLAGTAFAAALIWFFFIPRQLSFVIEEPRMLLGLGVFSGLGVLFSVLSERLKSINQSLEERVAQRTMELEASRKSIEYSEARMAGMVGSAMDAIISVDSEQNVVLFNTAAETMFRCSAAEALKQPLDRFIPQRFQEAHKKHVKGFGQTSHTSRSMRSLGTLSGVRANGDEFPIEASISQVEVAGQKTYTVILRDITERKEAEAALRASEEEFRTSFYSAAVGKAQVDPHIGRYLRVNAKLCEITGYSEEELLRMTFVDLTHPDDRADDKAAHESLTRGDVPGISLEKRYVGKDGRIVWVNVSTSLISDEGGQPLRTLAVIQDISARKEAEEALLESEARFAKAFHSNPAAMCITTIKNGRFIEVNERYCQMFGLTREELIGQSSVELALWADPETRTSFMGEVQSLGFIRNRETQFLRKNRDLLDALISMELIEFPGEHEPVVVSMFFDITGRKQSEAERIRLLHVLEASLNEIYIFDAQTLRFEYVNDCARRNLGYSMEAMSALTPVDLKPEFSEATFNEAIGPLRRHEKEKLIFQTVHRRADESLYPVEVHLQLVERDRDPVFLAVINDITERKQAEANVQKSNRELSDYVENANVCLHWVGPDGIILWANRAEMEFLGYAADEYIGQPISKFHADPPVIDDILQRLTRCEKLNSYEARLRAKDGSIKLVSINSSAYVDGEKFTHTRCFTTDITGRKSLELAVRESEERFRTMANSMSQLAWIAKADGFIFWYNQRWYEYTGTTPEQMEGWGWQSVHDPEVLPTVMMNWTSAIAAGQPFEMEFPLRAADGQFRTFLTRGLPLRDAAGKVTQWFGTNTDVDALKQAEAKVRQLNTELEQRVIERTAELEAVNAELLSSRAELKSLFESLPGLYLVLTPDFKIVAASDAYLRATLTTREGILGRDVFEVFPDNPDDPEADGVTNIRASLERVLHSGVADTVAIQKYDVRRPDGTFEEHYWSPVNSPLLDAEGGVRYIIHRVEEVTDFVRHKQQSTQQEEALSARLQQMEAEVFQSAQKIQAANKLLEAANKELESFSYSVSHDLRAPLRAMDGFSRAVLEDYGPQLPEEGRRHLQIIRSNTQKMGELIDDLLTFSRLSRAPLNKQKIDPRMLVQSALNELGSQREGRQIDLRIESLPECEGDPALLKQVWVNLLSNALKYSRKRERAVIEIGCRTEDGTNAYFVRDNGAGFDMRYAHKLFGVFQRLHRAEDYEGTGVGLAIVQRVIHRHGGRVWAESVMDQGATFHFTLEEEKTS